MFLHALGEQEYRQLRGRVSLKKQTELGYEVFVMELQRLFCDNRTIFQTHKVTPGNVVTVVDESKLLGDLFKFEELNLDKF